MFVAAVVFPPFPVVLAAAGVADVGWPQTEAHRQ
jgi:hypothetical protein